MGSGVGQIFEFVKIILFLKMFLEGGLAPPPGTNVIKQYRGKLPW